MADEERSQTSGEERAAGPSDADRQHLRRIQRQRQARVVKAVVALAIIVLLVVFVIRNSDPQPIDFVFKTGRFRLIYVLIVTALLGGIAGYLLGRPSKGTRLHEKKEGEPRKG